MKAYALTEATYTPMRERLQQSALITSTDHLTGETYKEKQNCEEGSTNVEPHI